ncbi:MAG: hypothetical protein HRU40_16390 [Saprospiraceae bacterium]|nr:hypothetical protein [Saprospiraceae bacterium]
MQRPRFTLLISYPYKAKSPNLNDLITTPLLYIDPLFTTYYDQRQWQWQYTPSLTLFIIGTICKTKQVFAPVASGPFSGTQYSNNT